MLDELTLLKEMLGDLTNAGIWGISIYVGYKLIIFGGTAFSFVYVIKLLATKIFDHLKADLTKAEVIELKEECQRKVDSANDRVIDSHKSASRAQRECDEVKSMYKILKQKYEAENE